MSKSELAERLEDLARWRRQLVMEEGCVQRAQAKWDKALEDNDEWKSLQAAKSSVALAKAIRDTIELDVRNMALEAYQATGNVKPEPGARINLTKRLEYDILDIQEWALRNAKSLLTLDLPRAVEWARENATDLLVLDEAAWRKAAEAMIGLGAPARIEREPKVLIASDLSQYLEKETDAE